MRVLAAWTLRIHASRFHRSPPFRVFHKNPFNALIDERSSAFQDSLQK